MLKKRIISCLDIKDGRTVKGVNFIDIKDAGDPVELATRYVNEGVDELVFLDITATIEKRKAFARLVEHIAEVINIPFTVGGGIQTVDDVALLLNAGADKVSINSAAVRDPSLIDRIANRYGSQCLVLAADTKDMAGRWTVVTHGGREFTDLETLAWVKEAEQRGAGEILLTSMDHDGVKHGFAVEMTDLISRELGIPVIASGGAGAMEHFSEVFKDTSISGALAASVFHFGSIAIPDLKQYLTEQNINVR
jgi:imidazole glycerol-phosphate synthase subunit HisF